MIKRILLSVVLLWSSIDFSYCASMKLNRGEIRTIIRRLVNDYNTDPNLDHFPTVLIDSFTNIVQNELYNYTWCQVGTTYYNLVEGQREYNFKADMFDVTRLTMQGNLIPQKSITKLDDDTSWESVTSSAVPTYYYIRHDTYSVIGFDVKPTTTPYSWFKVEYIKIPEKLTLDTEYPFGDSERLSPFFSYTLCFGVAAYLCYQDNRPIDGDRYYAMYDKGLKNMETIIRIRADYLSSVGGDRGTR